MKLTKKLESELRAMINPVYVEVKGTESFERNLLLGEIDRLRAYIKHLGNVTDTCIYPVIGEVCDGCKCVCRS